MTARDESGPLSGTSAPFHPAKEWLIALMIVVAGLGLYTARLKPHILNSYDQPLYLATAAEAVALGPGPHKKPLSMTIAPLYPAFIAVLTHLDPRLAATVACVPAPQDGHLESYPNDLGLLVWEQLLLMAGTGLLAGLPVIVGIQLLLSFLNFDMRFEPTQSLQAKSPAPSWMRAREYADEN